MKILVCQINPTVGALDHNATQIVQGIANGKNKGADLVLFPELCLTGYPPEDFLLLPHFLQMVEEKTHFIATKTEGIAAIVGLPRKNPQARGKPLFNSAAIFSDGKLIGYQDKTLLPTYDVFDERRYFEPALERNIFSIQGFQIAVTICEDIWQPAGLLGPIYIENPLVDYRKKKIDLSVNLSASPYSLLKIEKRIHVAKKAATYLKTPLILCNQVGGNDSLIFDGYSLFCNEKGVLTQLAQGFKEDYLFIDTAKPAQNFSFKTNEIKDLHEALILGIYDYFHKLDFKKAIIGLSGGIDSAVVACLAVEALGKENVLGVAMPSRYSSKGSVLDAKILANNLKIDLKEISIEGPFQSFLELMHPHFNEKKTDVTEENLQARIRAIILMALSNKHGYIVLSCGNKSELAMGYSTLYGDLSGGLAVLSDLTKYNVYRLAHYINQEKELIPKNILIKPPSAELRPNQKDSDSLPDYKIVDQVLEDYVIKHRSPKEIAMDHKYPLELVLDLVRRIHQNEYKRRQAPPSLRVSEKAFSVGRRFPIVQRWI
jgi:NAD+ synthase (glutamine-hydrolysing)